MNPFLLLIPAAAVLMLGSYLSYQPAFKATPWFPRAMILLYVANGWLWAWACRRAESDRQLYSVSVVWDCLTLFAYLMVPLLVVGVRPSWQAYIGVFLVVVGTLMVKIWS